MSTADANTGTNASCNDISGIFASVAACVGNSECPSGLAAATSLFGSVAGVCQTNVGTYSAAASGGGCPFAFNPVGHAQDALLGQLCPATCVDAGVYIAGCTPSPSPPASPVPPLPPPMPPLIPGPPGFDTVGSIAQL
eukprot:3770543-Prymnesium_polylepis.1